jgi:hypothetical protein
MTPHLSPPCHTVQYSGVLSVFDHGLCVAQLIYGQFGSDMHRLWSNTYGTLLYSMVTESARGSRTRARFKDAIVLVRFRWR